MEDLKDISEFNSILELSNGQPVLIDFYATWCGPCKALEPTLEAVKGEGYSVFKVNVDNSQLLDILSNTGIRSVPSLIFYKDGEESARMTGNVPKTEIINKFNSL